MRFLTALCLFFASAALAAAGDHPITVEDASARASGPNAPVGAAFMVLRNAGDTDILLTGAASGAAERAELHTHIADANGVMRMRPVEGGLTIPAHGARALERGGDHIMLMGLSGPLEEGASIEVTLSFDGAEDLDVDLPLTIGR